MLIRLLTPAISVALITLGLGCPMQPPSSGNDGQNGGNDNNGGNSPNGDGIDDSIGTLSASISRTISTSGALESVTAGAFFSRVEDLPDGSDVDQKTIGDCVVVTTTIGSAVPESPDIEPLDAGPSGTISSGGRTGMVMLIRQSAGVFTGPIDLANQGFAAGQTVGFEFPGGDDVAAFMASVELPGELTVTAPDLEASELMIDTNAALPIAWSAEGTADSVRVFISTTNVGSTVAITCTFDDTGSATVPQAAVECLLDNAVTTTVSVTLVNTAEVEVALVTGGTGSVQATAQTSLSRGLVADLDSGGGEFDVCQFISCPEGETCNPETFLCE